MLRRTLITIATSIITLILHAILIDRAAAQYAAPRAYLLHLPGVGGYLWVDHTLLAGLKSGGVNADITDYDWTGGHPGVPALHAYEANHKQAAHVADLIAKQITDHPGGRVVITSHSGGGGIAVWALEDLPAADKVDDVFLLAPALSPDYDLTAALRRVKDKMYLFYSSGDELILGIGCRLCGTMDGKMTNAAGYVGFTRPPTADPIEYQKLDQHPYDPNWMWLGNFGDHIGPMAQPFAAKILAPLVKGDAIAANAQAQAAK